MWIWWNVKVVYMYINNSYIDASFNINFQLRREGHL